MDDDKILNAARQTFHEYLIAKKKRCTSERNAILDCVMSSNNHFCIEEICEQTERNGMHVALATVYNTLELLVDCGLVVRHHFDNKNSKYEKTQGNIGHHHLVCTSCGKIKEMRDSEIFNLLNNKRYRTFYPAYFSLTIYGICSTCHRRAGLKKSKQLNH
jgi:Fur family ferric uptake transcriptional regulator